MIYLSSQTTWNCIKKKLLANCKSNVLDLFLTNDDECVLQQASSPLVPVEPWHVPFEVDLNIVDNQGTACPRPIALSYSKGNYLGLYEFLASTDWSVITSCKEDVDKQVTMLTDTVTAAMKMFIPVYKQSVSIPSLVFLRIETCNEEKATLSQKLQAD
ncbi:unnamed protein product [Ixodes hexagonus]